MARYEFRCGACGDRFELTRPMAESDAPADCSCGEHAERVFSSIAVTGRAGGAVSSPAPAAAGGGCCGGGCCCCGS